MFFQLLERLRGWPEGKRKLAAVIFTSVFMVIIFAVWVSSFMFTGAPIVNDNAVSQTAVSIQLADTPKSGDVGSPWATLTGAFGDVVNRIGDSLVNLKDSFSKFEVVNSATIPTASSSSVATTTPY